MRRVAILAAFLPALVLVGFGVVDRAVHAGGTGEATFTVVVEGPGGPYPAGHAELIVTIYDAATDTASKTDAAADVVVLGQGVKRVAQLNLPETLTITVPADRLQAAHGPLVSAVISITRRLRYVAEAPVSLTQKGPTQVRVQPLN